MAQPFPFRGATRGRDSCEHDAMSTIISRRNLTKVGLADFSRHSLQRIDQCRACETFWWKGRLRTFLARAKLSLHQHGSGHLQVEH